MKVTVDDNEEIVRQYETIIDVRQMRNILEGLVQRLTLRISDIDGELDLFKRVFYEKTAGYGIIYIQCSHTLDAICYFVYAEPPRVVYQESAIITETHEKRVFTNTYAITVRLYNKPSIYIPPDVVTL